MRPVSNGLDILLCQRNVPVILVFASGRFLMWYIYYLYKMVHNNGTVYYLLRAVPRDFLAQRKKITSFKWILLYSFVYEGTSRKWACHLLFIETSSIVYISLVLLVFYQYRNRTHCLFLNVWLIIDLDRFVYPLIFHCWMSERNKRYPLKG